MLPCEFMETILHHGNFPRKYFHYFWDQKIEKKIDTKSFWLSSLFQNNCLQRSNEKVNQDTCFVENISWTLAEPEGQGLGAEVPGSNYRVGAREWTNLGVLFSLEKCWIHPISNGLWSICLSDVFNWFKRSDQVAFSF